MAGIATTRKAMVVVEDEGCSLTCECWDCRSWRRHLVKIAAIVVLVCGLGGNLAWQRGAWRGGVEALSAQEEVAAVATVPGAWL